MQSDTPPPKPAVAPEDIYTFGYSHAAVQMMAGRTAESSASFFLAHIRSGMNVLDCGCGPGTITVGFAQVVAPAEVVGVDLEASQVAIAQTYAAERGVTNARFEIGNIYDLPFPDNTFDAAFGHTIVMQLRDPIIALAEVHRVLKPGGVVGFREVDFGGNLYEPSDVAWREFWELFGRVLQYNGGNPHVGRQLGRLLRLAGFDRLTVSASYVSLGTPERRRMISDLTARFCEEAPFVDQAIALGWVDRDARRRLSAALREEGTRSDGFFAAALCEVVARKEGSPA